MLQMTEPQVWTLIGVFGAALFGMLTLMSTMFVRVIRTEVGGLRSEMRAEFVGLRAEMNARFESVDRRFDYLERHVQALTKRALGE